MKKLDNRSTVILTIFVCVILNGGLSPLTKIGVKEFSPSFFSFLRFFVATVALLPIFAKSRIKLDKDLVKLILASLLATGNIFLFAYGIRFTTANIGQLLYALVPITVAVFSYFLLKDRLSQRKVLGIALGFAGAFFIVFLPKIASGAGSTGSLKGNLIILTALISYSIYSVFTKKFSEKYSPVQITMVFFLTTTIVTFILSLRDLAVEGQKLLAIHLPSLLSVLYVGILGTALFYVLYQYAVKHGSPLIASTILYLVPVSTVIWSHFLLGEQLTVFLVAGGALVLSGTYFILRSKSN